MSKAFQPVHGTRLWVYVAGTIVAWILVFWVLDLLPARHKRGLIVGCTFLAGLFYSLEFFLPAKASWLPGGKNPLSDLVGPMGNAVSVVFGFTLALGLINLCLVHGRNLGQLKPGWHNSLAFFLALVSMTVFGLWQSYVKDGPQRTLFGLSGSSVHRVDDVLFNGLFQPLGATMFSVLAFYIASAAFRAFRVRTAEAVFMMAAAFVVMLGQVPVGYWLTHWLPLPEHSSLGYLRFEVLANWILNYWSMAAIRAIEFGIAVGALAMALRVWLSLERGSFFEVRETPR
jgi:hypothetical protein